VGKPREVDDRPDEEEWRDEAGRNAATGY
jgi:hypothetical protein